MFASPVAMQKTKSAEHQRAPVAPQRHGQPAVSQVQLLQRRIGNQALLRLLAKRAGATLKEFGAPENAARLPGAIQATLKIGAINDPLEHEADRVAGQVMRMPAPDVSAAASPPQVSRECAECEEEGKLQKEPSGMAEAAAGEAPGSVHEVLRAPGQPLDASSRSYFEPRFGQDFSGVRVHTGAAAEQSARDVNAHAYTVGHNMVFGAGRFAPGTHEGRGLIAHELTHVVQQSGYRGATGIDPLPVLTLSVGPMLSRACDPLGCPTLELPLLPFVPSWQLAEKCLQDQYQKNNSGHTVGTNKDWVGLTGKNPHEQAIIDCFRLHFTAKGYKPKEEPEEEFNPAEVEQQGSQQRQAEPDIFDFTNLTIIEITTPNGLPYRAKKITWEVGLANQLMGECHIGGKNLWQVGLWSPSPCYQLVGAGANLAGKLFFRTWNVGGVLVYVPVLDITREALAVATATAAIALWKGIGGALGKKAVGPLVAATAVAALIMLANGAELSADPSEDSILEAFFKHATDKGMKVPDDVKAALKKNKKLRDLLVKAGRKKGGDMSDEARQAMEEITKTIAEHADEFTDEELEQLVRVAEEAQAAVPNAKMSVEDLKRSLKAKGRGQKPEPGKKGGGGGEITTTIPVPTTDKPATARLPIPQDLLKGLADDKAANEIVEELITDKGVKIDAAFVKALLEATKSAKPPLTVEEAREIMSMTTFGKESKPEEVLERLRKRIAERRPAAGAAGGVPSGQAPTTSPPTPDPSISITDITETVEEAGKAAAAEKARKATAEGAKAKLKDPSLYDKIPADKFRVLSLYNVSADLKIASGTQLPSLWIVGRFKDGRLYAGVIAPIAIASVWVKGATEHWTVKINPTPVYDANGNQVEVLPAHTIELDLNRYK